MNELKTFENIVYERPDFDKVKAFYGELNARLQVAKTYEEVKRCILDEEEFSSHINTMATVAEIRHTVDTSDEFYEKESEYINQSFPEAMPYMQAFNMALLASPL